MPIYEYQCSACQHPFDLMQKMGDAPIKLCPQCGQMTAVRLVSAAGFQLKGTGWYVTDFKDKGKPKEATPSADKAETVAIDSGPKKTSEQGVDK